MSVFKGWKQIPKPGVIAPITHLTWTRAGGEARQVWYKGTFDYCYAKLQANKADFDSASISQEGQGTMYKLELAQAGDDITEVHDVGGSDLMQAKIANLYLQQQIIADASADAPPVTVDSINVLLAAIAQVVNDFKSNGNKTTAELETAIQLLTTSPKAIDLAYELLLLGDNFLQSQYTYVHTITVAERIYEAGEYDEGPIYADVGKIFTEQQMINAEDIPENFGLPPKVLDGEPAEWLKRAPHSVLTTGQKRMFTIPYLFADSWSRLDYQEK